jgi:hypothetical protein
VVSFFNIALLGEVFSSFIMEFSMAFDSMGGFPKSGVLG